MWRTVLDKMLAKLVVTGRLGVTWPDGSITAYGPGGDLEAKVRLTEESIVRELGQRPVLALGEGYMDGRIDVSPEQLYPFMALLIRNQQSGAMPRWFDTVQALRGWRHEVFGADALLLCEGKIALAADGNDVKTVRV